MAKDQFQLTEKEKTCNQAIGQDQVDMIDRLVTFVNDRLAEIETLETEVNNLKPKKGK